MLNREIPVLRHLRGSQYVHPERLYERFLAYRVGLGMEILPLTGGDGDLMDTLSARLRAGRTESIDSSALHLDILRDLKRIEVDPETYSVKADGEHLTCEPAQELPLAQRYFLF